MSPSLQRNLVAAVISACATASMATEIPEHYTSPRAEGMGNAFTSIANDENSVWTNPAGLCRIRKPRSKDFLHAARFPNIAVGANSKAQTFYQDIMSAEDAISDSIAENDAELGAGGTLWAGSSVFPNLIVDINRTPVLAGGYSFNRNAVYVTSDAPESAQIESVSDFGGILAISLPNRTNLFSVGASVRYVERFAWEETVPTDELADSAALQERFQAGYNQTTGYGLDVGMIYTMADFWYPTFGISVLDVPLGCKEKYLNPFSKMRETVCGTVFSGTFYNEDAVSMVDATDVRVGFSIMPRLARGVSLRLAADAHHIPINTGTQVYGLQGIEVSKLIHGGAELFLGNPLAQSNFSLRAGARQGFWTAGASMSFAYMLLEVATYGVDVSSTSKAVEDRRTLANFSFIF